jgi:hypothetical protein
MGGDGARRDGEAGNSADSPVEVHATLFPIQRPPDGRQTHQKHPNPESLGVGIFFEMVGTPRRLADWVVTGKKLTTQQAHTNPAINRLIGAPNR